MKKRYAASVMASRRIVHSIMEAENQNRHAVVMIEADSLDEAVGIAHRVARAGYKIEDDFRQHSVVVIPADQEATVPEKVEFSPPK